MKTLTTAAINAKDSTTPRPVGILKIVFGGETGTVYYADNDLSSPVTAAGKIRDWGEFSNVLEENKPAPEGEITITLADPDGSLRTLLHNPGFTNREAVIYQHFRGLDESDMVPILTGRVCQSPIWHEDKKEVWLTISDTSVIFRDHPLGTVATRELFPKMRLEDEGRILPLVYGRPHRVRAVLAKSGAQTELVRYLSRTGNKLYVKNSKEFPSGTIKLRVGSEMVEGSFNGNTFTITQRPASVQSGSVTDESDSPLIVRDSTLPATENNVYAGMFLKVTISEREQFRQILYSVASTGALVIDRPLIGPGGDSKRISSGTDFEILSPPVEHKVGEHVTEVLDNYIYIIAGHPVQAVDAVEGWGEVQHEVKVEKIVYFKGTEGYEELPPQYYTVNTNDTTTFPSLGHAITTVSMQALPLNLPARTFLSHEIFATVRGYQDGSSGLIENPAEVIAHLLENHCGLSSSQLDSSAFSAAATARTDRLFAFAIDRPGRALQVAADLAFQACLSLTWDSGKVRPIILSHDSGTADDTLAAGDMEAGSVGLTYSPPDEIATEITAHYMHRGTEAALTVSDSDAENLHGSRRRELSLWAYEGRHHVRHVAEWWLRRLRHRYRRVRLTTFLAALAAERGDTLVIDRSDLLPENQQGRIIAVDHMPGNISEGRMDRISLTLQLPTWEGCGSSCEHACESTACESLGCELSCTAANETGCGWTCETTCEEACQLSCTSACQLSCQGTCMVSLREGVDTSCESTCETGCESACEGWACETSAESGCATTCQSATTEIIFPIRQVKIIDGVTTQYGTANVVQVDRGGATIGETFMVHDPFDVHPQAGEEGTVYLNFNYQWVFIPSYRPVKYVSIIDTGAETDQFEVQEQSRTGSGWGETFMAWAVDSV